MDINQSSFRTGGSSDTILLFPVPAQLIDALYSDGDLPVRVWEAVRWASFQLRSFENDVILLAVTDNWLLEVEKALLGLRCEGVRRDPDWTLNLTGGGSIALPLPWRIVADNRIVFARDDDGQWFGLPAPVDGEAKADSLIALRIITGIRVDRQTLDLTVFFDGEVRLDAFSNSSGYEGWRIYLPPESGGLNVAALGGGEVAMW